MAQDRKITKYEVSPIEEGDVLVGLKIQRTERITRESATGKTLNYGYTVDVGDPLEIPISKISDLIRELADWPIWYASTPKERR
ncbi:hypothetical protein PBI_LARENN_75 [Mycobacterium phage Larenn]|uniref:Uncharacterized protein n=1 Tax=Mycobacterium phage Larenn TaxID=1560285 RepID=A0A0A0RN56_9CAUD|nr:hypothetical protein PBI_LARENN_75 [Mycobacterium phage Larenn]AIW02970.1 hypothetical protein PBI_LARENN_75 [Mycobacterium phage Larenn]